MIFPDSVYKVLKWLCLIGLPAATACYYTLSTIWGLPYSAEITGTVSAITALIGCLIGISSVNYNTNDLYSIDIDDFGEEDDDIDDDYEEE